MTTVTEDQLSLARNEVFRRFGQAILRLQSYERLAKSIVATHHVSAPVADLEKAQVDRVARVGGKTLGMVVAEMLGSFLVPDGTQAIGPSPDDTASVSYRMRVILPAEDFDRTRSDLSDLVKMRNDLVHNFLGQHELATLEGCLMAQAALTRALDRVAQAYGDLRRWAEDLAQTGQLAAERVSSAEIRDFILDGSVPWPRTQIAQALQDALRALASDGWAQVDAAVHWVNARYPDEQPDGYGCTSWRQVIHESRLFDLRYRPYDESRQAWYRLRSGDMTTA